MIPVVVSATSSSLKGLITSPGVEIKLESPSVERTERHYLNYLHAQVTFNRHKEREIDFSSFQKKKFVT